MMETSGIHGNTTLHPSEKGSSHCLAVPTSTPASTSPLDGGDGGVAIDAGSVLLSVVVVVLDDDTVFALL